jgi:hypothetical protein
VKTYPKERYFTIVRMNLAWAIAEMLGPYIVNQSRILFTDKLEAQREAQALAELTSLPFRE